MIHSIFVSYLTAVQIVINIVFKYLTNFTYYKHLRSCSQLSLMSRFLAIILRVINLYFCRSGRGRRITVYKRRVRAKKIRENNITRFKLSEEAKDVSLNLFTRYPPYDCGSGDKMVGKFVEKTSRRQGPDPFFSRPLMSKFDIKRKVELLTNKLESDPKLKKVDIFKKT